MSDFVQVRLFFKLIVIISDARIVHGVSGSFLFNFVCVFSG